MLKGLEHFIVKHPEKTAIVFIVLLLVSSVALVLALLIWRACSVTKARLSAAMIHQMDCTQQAERRSLNKSSAFANASHDIRGALGAIITLIELSYDFVLSGSEVEGNLRQMHTSATDLMGLLNTLLDTSKIEAGRLELEDAEFNIVQLLEEVADFYHPTAMKKGVEVVLDLCDNSVTKFSNVRGDRLRLKQIICNLVSNAVKFTPKGNVSIRVWARKPCIDLVESTSCVLVSSHEGSCLNWILRKLFKDEHSLEAIRTPQQNPNCIEYIIEVDDTGMGIPKDKQKSVFENFVQVKENSLSHGGTGLGLGIVQSLVRLMGGDIGIVDKEPGKEGTRFKFNIFLADFNPHIGPDHGAKEEADMEAPPVDTMQMVSAYDVPQRQKVDGSSLVVLLIHNNERRRVVKRYFERLGIKVSVVKHWEYFQGHLRRIKNMVVTQSQNSTTDWTSSQSDYMSTGRSAKLSHGKEVPLSSLDGMMDEQAALAGGAYSTRTNNKGAPNFILFLIDVSAGQYAEMAAAVEEFRTIVCNNVKSTVVWLEKPTEGCSGLVVERMKLPEDAIIMSKPLHGSRLHQVVRVLPEFRGNISTPLANYHNVNTAKQISKGKHRAGDTSEIQEEWSSDSERILTIKGRQPRVLNDRDGAMQSPLSGLRILVAEDNPLLAQLAHKTLSMLGANDVHVVNHGKEALDAVLQGLKEPVGCSERALPFDLILMDCEMPVMSGFEATQEIRKAEKLYDVHIPIIALTAHISQDQIKETEVVGMDGYMAKPINKDAAVETITCVCLSACLPNLTSKQG